MHKLEKEEQTQMTHFPKKKPLDQRKAETKILNQLEQEAGRTSAGITQKIQKQRELMQGANLRSKRTRLREINGSEKEERRIHDSWLNKDADHE